MYECFTDRARKVMQLAHQEAQRFNHEYIGTEHILLGLVQEGAGVAANVLKNLDIDLRKIRLEVEKIVQPGPDMVTMGKLPQTPLAKKVIECTIEEARALNHNYVGTEHILLGLLRVQDGVAAQVLMNLGLKLENLRSVVLQVVGGGSDRLQGTTPVDQAAPPKMPALDFFGLDLTRLARQGKLSPVVGRRDEIERLLMVLGCRSQNNPVLVGPIGVGKAAVVRGLAQQSADADWAEPLGSCRFVALSVAQMIAFAQNAGLFKKAVKGLVEEVRQAREVILFIDDLATLAGVRYDVSYVGSVLRAALARQEIRCITIATEEQFKRCFSTDGVLGRHFQPVPVRPPAKEDALEILRGVRALYETHHRVRIRDEALAAAVELSERYLPDRCLPGKAVHVLDEAGSLLRLRNAAQPPDTHELDVQIEQLNQEKETAIAEQDFEKAAGLSDQADRLIKRRRSIIREWRRTVDEVVLTVDKALVAEVINRMTGQPTSA